MPPQDDPPGSGDWSFPPVEPASPSAPAERPRQGAAPPPVDFSRLPPTSRRPVPAAGGPLFGRPTFEEPTFEERPVEERPFEERQPQPALLPEPVPMPDLHVPRRLPADGGPVSPLRAMAGALVAVAGVLLGIGALLWATDAPKGDPTLTATQAQRTAASPSTLFSPSPEPSPSPSPSPVVVPTAAVSAPPTVPAAPPKLALTVLNNSNRTGLADRAARRFQAGGWPITLTGNFTGRVSDTTVYYAPGQLESARLLQRSFAGLTRVRPRFEGLPGSGLTVVLTRDFNA